MFDSGFAYPNHSGRYFPYAVSGDGQRFLVMQGASTVTAEEDKNQSVAVVLNWFEELKQRVPVK